MSARLGRCELSPPRSGIDSSSKMPARTISGTLEWILASTGRSRGAPIFGGSRRGTHLPFSNSSRVKRGSNSDSRVKLHSQYSAMS